MAEAHSAVAFGFQVNHDGVSVTYDQELLRNIWHSIVHSYKRRIGRFKNNFYTGIYPASPGTLLFVVCVLLGFYLCRIDICFGLIDWIRLHLFGALFRPEGYVSLVASPLLASVFVWFLLVQAVRYGIKLLLTYHGWMFDTVEKASYFTYLYLWVVKKIVKATPMLNSFQGALPRLPLPSVHETVKQYLLSVKPILSEEKFKEMELLSQEFENGAGKKFQWYLRLKSLFSSNYVSDWWEEYVYLRGRSPIMINSNYYGMDTVFHHPTQIQAARAANVTYSALLFKRQLERQELKPMMILKSVPLCSSQYERLFTTCRIPGEETDTLKHWEHSKHICVYRKGCWYKMPVHTGKRLLSPAELEKLFQSILDADDVPAKGERHLAALTAGERTPWAKVRAAHFASGINKASLLTIERAIFILILDEEEQHYDPDDESCLDRWAHAMIHGKGYDRFFDKSFNIIIAKNGRVGVNAEHSWGDAPIMAHFIESTLLTENIHIKYADDGHCLGSMELSPPYQRLKWDISDECNEAIERSLSVAQALIKDVEMSLLVFQAFGRGLMKRSKISPDAFIQMALHVTYFKLEGKFCLTYEAAMTRLFREARTETVRSCTSEAAAFVRAFLDPEAPKEEKVELLRMASDSHVMMYKKAMCGQGIDRHIFALYVVSRYLEIQSPFLERIIHEPWVLSTSQTPLNQTELLDLNKNPQFISTGGGFGPVTDWGYGVSYITAGDHTITFHISSKVSCPHTSSKRFRETLNGVLLGMKALFE